MHKLSDYQSLCKSKPSWEFPEFSLDEYRKKNSNYCVIVFVINEGLRIRKQLQKMKVYSNDLDIIVADGGSTDGSLDRDFLVQQNVRALLTKMGPGKLSAQMRMAFAWAIQEKYDGVIVVDGNGKDDVSALPLFVSRLDEGYDHIQGSRFIPGGAAYNTPLLRELGLHLLHAPLISLASRQRHTDTTNGFRAYSSRLLSDPNIAVFRNIFQAYELHYHLAIESSRSRVHKTIEVPVTRSYPKGKTPTKISPLKGNLLILKTLFMAALGLYSNKPTLKQGYAIWAIAVLGFLSSFLIANPGFVSNDSISQWNQVTEVTTSTDWHPPVMIYIWRVLYAFTGQFNSILVLQLSMFWLAIGLLSVYLYRSNRSWLAATLPFLVAVSPLVAPLTGVIWKDVQLMAALLLASALMINFQKIQHGKRSLIFLSIVLILYAAVLRHNALVAVIPLLYWWLSSYAGFLSKLKRIGIAVLLPLTALVFTNAIWPTLGTKPANPISAVMLDDIIGIKSPTNYSSADSSLRSTLLGIQARCLEKAIVFNSYWVCTMENERVSISGSDYEGLRRVWVHTVMDRPLVYIQYRFYAFTVFLFGEGKQYITTVEKPKLSNGLYQGIDPVGYTGKIIMEYVDWLAYQNFRIFFQPWLWLTVAFAVIYRTAKSKDIRNKMPIISLATSGVLYIVSYIPMVVATDYRYIYWSVVAIMISIVMYTSEYNKRKKVAAND